MVVLILGAAALQWRTFDHLIEDAYISFRYARHWADGPGPVYNPGERVEGYSNFLWVALLAAAHRGGLPIPEAARWMGLLFGLLALNESRLLVRGVLREARGAPWAQWLPPLGLALWPCFAAWPLSGMETAAFAFFLTRGLRLYAVRFASPAEQAPPFLGQAPAMLALACLTRPEGLYWAGGLTAAAWIRRGVSLRSAFGGVDRREVWSLWVPVLAYYAWKLHYYGALLPNSFGAKYGFGPDHSSVGLDYLIRFLWGGWGGWGLLAAMILFAMERGRPFREILALLAGFTALIAYMGGDIYPFARYFTPILPVVLALGTGAVVLLLSAPRGKAAAWGMGIFAAAGLLLVHPPGTAAERAVWEGLRTNDRARLEFVQYNKGALAAVDSLAIQDAGIIPFHLDATAIDMLGLNDAHIGGQSIPEGERGAFGHEKHDADYVLARKPSLVFFVLHHWTPAQVRIPGIGAPGDLSFPDTVPLVLLRFDELPAQTGLWENPEFKVRYRPRAVDFADKRIVLYFRDGELSALLDRPGPLGEEGTARLVAGVLRKGIYEEGRIVLDRLKRAGRVGADASSALEKAIGEADPERLGSYRRGRAEMAARHLRRARAADEAGRREEAARILGRAARTYPEDRSVLRFRADRWLGEGHAAGAWALYRRLLDGGGGGPDLWSAAGRALKALGRSGEAAECWRRALALDPNFLPAREALRSAGKTEG